MSQAQQLRTDAENYFTSKEYDNVHNCYTKVKELDPNLLQEKDIVYWAKSCFELKKYDFLIKLLKENLEKNCHFYELADLLISTYRILNKKELRKIANLLYNESSSKCFEAIKECIMTIPTQDLEDVIYFLFQAVKFNSNNIKIEDDINNYLRQILPNDYPTADKEVTTVTQVKQKERLLAMISYCMEHLNKNDDKTPIENKVVFVDSWPNSISISNISEITEKTHDQLIKQIFSTFINESSKFKNILIVQALKEDIIIETIQYSNTEGYTDMDEGKYIISDNVKEHTLAITPVSKKTGLPVPYLSMMFIDPVDINTIDYGKYFIHFVKDPLSLNDWMKDGFLFANQFTKFDLYHSKRIDIDSLSDSLKNSYWWLNVYRHSAFLQFLTKQFATNTFSDSMIDDYFDNEKVEFIVRKWINVIQKTTKNYFTTIQEMDGYKLQLSEYLTEALMVFKQGYHKVSTMTFVLQIEQVVRKELQAGAIVPLTRQRINNQGKTIFKTFKDTASLDKLFMNEVLDEWLKLVSIQTPTTNYTMWLASLKNHLAEFYSTQAISFPNRNEIAHASATARHVDRTGSLRVILILDLIFHTIHSNEHAMTQQSINPYQEELDKYNKKKNPSQ